MDEVTFVFSVDEANVVLDALGQMPYARVASVVQKMLLQVAEQKAE